MTDVTRHPNCRCGATVGDNPYCIIHGRVRDMDQGASPFADPDAIAAQMAAETGIQEEDIDRNQDVPGVIGAMHRQNLEDDLEKALSDSFDKLKEAGEADDGCKCDFSQMLGGPVRRHTNPRCPVHGEGPREDYDIDGTAEEF